MEAIGIEAPAGSLAVDQDATAVVRSGVHGNEFPLWRRRLARTIIAPARDGTVPSQATRVVLESHADGDELALWR